MATLTPEAQQIFGATYKVPEEIWLKVHFTDSEASRAAGREFLKRFLRRTENRDPEVNEKVAPAQIEAIGKWGAPRENPFDYLKAIAQPTLVVNGDNDVIVYSINSWILQQNPGVDGVDDHVVVAVDYQRRLRDGLQVVEGIFARRAPLANCFDLGGSHFLVHLRIAVFSAAEETLQEFAAGGPAGFRVGEVDLEPDLLRHLVGGAEDLLRFRREGRHVLAAARAGADQHQAPDQLRGRQRDLLGDEAADRAAEHIDLLQCQRLDEGNGVGAHLLERGRHLARSVATAPAVAQDHLPRRRKAVGHPRIPMVDRPGEVLVENERHAARFAEPTIGESDAV